MPKKTVAIDVTKTSMFLIDPQKNDFLSKYCVTWELFGPGAIGRNVVIKGKDIKSRQR